MWRDQGTRDSEPHECFLSTLFGRVRVPTYNPEKGILILILIPASDGAWLFVGSIYCVVSLQENVKKTESKSFHVSNVGKPENCHGSLAATLTIRNAFLQPLLEDHTTV